jgi:hypothetical protein
MMNRHLPATLRHSVLDEDDDVYNESNSLRISSMRQEGMRRKHELLKDLTPMSRKKDSSL